MPEEIQNIDEQTIKQLLEENLKLTQEIHAMTKKVKKYVTFQEILSIIYIIIFVVPLILAVVYIPVFLRNYLGPYQNLLNDGQGTGNIMKNINPNNLPKVLNQAQDILNN